ncbi:MAG: U32 family peptidase [Desulfotignum sp.]|nr:U32 family peptidase [Desulfotignum sp.]
MRSHMPAILAPAGDKTTFLAAVAAGADAIYCGLKLFSARMEATNFSIEELSRLSRMARSRQIDVHIAFNTLIKESEIPKALRLLSKLQQHVVFDALIVQDPAVISLARQAGITQDLHLSTLGNLSSPAGLESARNAGFSQVVLPREFSLDDIRAMAAQTPEDMGLEVFVHGALCYSISGRCYWSSWFGGKSALRGRCVQPCRRMYQVKSEKHRYFSCMDFSADVLAKVLKEIPQVHTWKIEGRKKSPHYVYYTIKAFQLLRDDPSRKKEALTYLDYALGRPFNHYHLLSHRVQNPLDHQDVTQSGLFLGRIKNPAAPFFITKDALFPEDLLRIGNEEDAFHTIQKVTRSVPQKGKFTLPRQLRHKVRKHAPVHLIDRRTNELTREINALDVELADMEKIPVRPAPPTDVSDKNASNTRRRTRQRITDIRVSRKLQGQPQTSGASGLWISGSRYSTPFDKTTWLWLDPSIFPEEECLCRQYITTALKKGARHFVLNAVWQISLFDNPPRLDLWAGPFCNIANSLAIQALKTLGFSGAIVSPELDKNTFLSLPESSVLPLGVVIAGNWPLAVSRTLSPGLSPGDFFMSPKKEGAWVTRSNDLNYIFPNWPLDLTAHRKTLAQAGYACFITLEEPVPKNVSLKDRPGLWNWDLTLL